MVDARLINLLEDVLGKGKNTARNNMAFHCPFCHSTNKKLEVQIITSEEGENRWHCWRCSKAGHKLTTLFKALNVDRNKLSALYDLLNLSKRFAFNRKSSAAEYKPDLSLPKEFIPLWQPSKSIEYKNAMFYLCKKRGLTLSEIVKYGIGYCEEGEYAKKIIIPSYDENGKLNYFIGRSYYDSESFRYMNPDYSKNIVGHELFINWSLPLVLVEGAFDAIAVRRNCIPLFGKTISGDLYKKIIQNKVSEVYICLDKDAQKQALKHAEHFMNNGIQVYLVDLYDKDPADIGFHKMCELIKQTQPLTFEKFIQYKLSL